MMERYDVLVVSDRNDAAEKLIVLLEQRFHVSRVSTAAEALSELGRTSYHVICCDHTMSETEGVRFLQSVLARPEPPCFLLITAAAEVKDQKLDGISGVIMKPYDDQTLSDRISRLCQITETRRLVASARNAMKRSADDMNG